MRDRVFNAASGLFAVLAAPYRVRILCELCGHELNVSELLASIGGSQPNLSHHLRGLYEGGVVMRRREGSKVFYRVAPQRREVLTEMLRVLGVMDARPS